MKLLALMSRCTKPLRWICYKRVMIWSPMLMVVERESFLSLSEEKGTRVGRGLRASRIASRWPWRGVRFRRRSHAVCWCRLNRYKGTDALEDLVEFDLIVELAFAFAFFFLYNLIAYQFDGVELFVFEVLAWGKRSSTHVDRAEGAGTDLVQEFVFFHEDGLLLLVVHLNFIILDIMLDLPW